MNRRPVAERRAVGATAGDDALIPGGVLPGGDPGTSDRTRAARRTAGTVDRETVMHVYGVETLYVAVVDGSAHIAPAASWGVRRETVFRDTPCDTGQEG